MFIICYKMLPCIDTHTVDGEESHVEALCLFFTGETERS